MFQTPTSILRDDGSCDVDARAILPDEDVLSLIELIIFNREMDRLLLKIQRQGRLAFHLTSVGEEAVTIGTAYALEESDPIFISYRELGSVLYRKVPLDEILNQFLGNSQDGCKGRQMPVHYCYKEYAIPSVSSPVGTQLPQAVGYAYAAKLRNTGEVALAYLGEGTASGNDFHSALNFSGVLKAPVIFMIRNNGYAISTPTSQQTAAETLAIRAAGYGIHGAYIDGNDILMVIQTVREAARRARAHQEATLIEAVTYRIGAHSSSDDPSRYRSDDEVAFWSEHGPLKRLISHAQWRGIWKDSYKKEFVKKANSVISKTFAACESFAAPAISTMFTDVYAKKSNLLLAQEAQYRQFLKSRNGVGDV